MGRGAFTSNAVATECPEWGGKWAACFRKVVYESDLRVGIRGWPVCVKYLYQTDGAQNPKSDFQYGCQDAIIPKNVMVGTGDYCDKFGCRSFQFQHNAAIVE